MLPSYSREGSPVAAAGALSLDVAAVAARRTDNAKGIAECFVMMMPAEDRVESSGESWVPGWVVVVVWQEGEGRVAGEKRNLDFAR